MIASTEKKNNNNNNNNKQINKTQKEKPIKRIKVITNYRIYTPHTHPTNSQYTFINTPNIFTQPPHTSTPQHSRTHPIHHTPPSNITTIEIIVLYFKKFCFKLFQKIGHERQILVFGSYMIHKYYVT